VDESETVDQVDELREFVECSVNAIIESEPKTDITFAKIDKQKLSKLAIGDLSFRDFAVFCAIRSSVGDQDARAITSSVIAARAAGYVRLKDVPQFTETLSRGQISRAVNQLIEHDYIWKATPRFRVTYYSGWKLHSGIPKELGMKSFATAVTRMSMKKSNRSSQIISDTITEETCRLKAAYTATPATPAPKGHPDKPATPQGANSPQTIQPSISRRNGPLAGMINGLLAGLFPIQRLNPRGELEFINPKNGRVIERAYTESGLFQTMGDQAAKYLTTDRQVTFDGKVYYRVSTRSN
jgi:hypothetical protein